MTSIIQLEYNCYCGNGIIRDPLSFRKIHYYDDRI